MQADALLGGLAQVEEEVEGKEDSLAHGEEVEGNDKTTDVWRV